MRNVEVEIASARATRLGKLDAYREELLSLAAAVAGKKMLAEDGEDASLDVDDELENRARRVGWLAREIRGMDDLIDTLHAVSEG